LARPKIFSNGQTGQQPNQGGSDPPRQGDAGRGLMSFEKSSTPKNHRPESGSEYSGSTHPSLDSGRADQFANV